MKGKKAYLIYGRSVGFLNFRGEPMPEFHSLPKHIQTAWANVENELSREERYDRFKFPSPLPGRDDDCC